MANMSVQPSTTHCCPVMPPRSRLIAGRATLTTNASSVTTKNASTATANAGPRKRCPADVSAGEWQDMGVDVALTA